MRVWKLEIEFIKGEKMIFPRPDYRLTESGVRLIKHFERLREYIRKTELKFKALRLISETK